MHHGHLFYATTIFFKLKLMSLESSILWTYCANKRDIIFISFIQTAKTSGYLVFVYFNQKQNSYIKSARRVYERAIEFFGEEHINERLLLEFSIFEEHLKELLKTSVDLINLIPESIKQMIIQKLNEDDANKKE